MKRKLGAVVFDMDGVLVDSNPHHLEKWKEFLWEHKIPYREAGLDRQLFGGRNEELLRAFFGPERSDSEIQRLEQELEARFRESFRPHAKPLAGLMALIEDLEKARVPLAVASSALPENVEFILERLGLRSTFRVVTTGKEVIQPKPDPEIYTLTLKKLGVSSEQSVAFEDSFPGIEAAKAAGMKCVAVASTFPADDLRRKTRADRVIESFLQISVSELTKLVDGPCG